MFSTALPLASSTQRHVGRVFALAFALILAACGGGTDQPADDGASVSAVANEADAGDSRSFALSAKAATTAAAAGRVYYVDSAAGDDSNDGLSGAAGVRPAGPWRTLARLNRATLAPGDEVRLACGRSWRDTIRITTSGQAGLPIYVGAYPAGCSNLPVVDGGVPIAVNAWVQQGSSNIYRAPLAFAPRMVSTGTGPLPAAHHPNRGFDPAVPGSPYLRNAVASDKVQLSGAQRSTYVTSGSDLALPAGATLDGARVRIRTNSWVIDESAIASISGSRINLSTPTSYPVEQGWGYYLLGKQWMLDSAGEWFHDPVGGGLFAWMPDSRAPAAVVYAIQLETGIDLRSRSHVVVEGLAFKRVGVAVNMRNSNNVTLRNVVVEDTADMGVDAAESVAATIESSTLNRVGIDAISGADNTSGSATGMRVINNRISNAGVVMNGEVMVSLPRRSFAAIRSGISSTVTGNTVVDSGNIGIKIMAGSTASGNAVRGACAVLDDCGGIYTSGLNNGSVIRDNIVQNSRGWVAGKPAAVAYTQAQGIYLDESASRVTVSNNTVVNADNGIQLHIAANNTVTGNKLYGNRNAQVWLQETSNRTNPSGDVHSNVVTDNHIVSTSPSALGVLQTTTLSSTYAFAAYDRNKYFDKVYTTISSERTPLASSFYNLQAWKTATTTQGSPRNLDPNGTGSSELTFAGYRSVGASIVPNTRLLADLTGWTSWNETAPFGVMYREACTPGWCATYRAGNSPGMLSTPFFNITGGQWYRLSVDVRAGSENQYQPVVVRNGGGGTAGYERVSNVAMSVSAGTAWKRYSFVFQATKSVTIADPATGGKGARLDFEQTKPGNWISVANIEIVPISSLTTTTRSDVLVNASNAATQIACPVAATNAAMCANYVRFADNQPVTWPHYAPAMSADIVYTLDRSLVDTDGDGVADVEDRCPASPRTLAVNAAGCALGQ